MECITSLSHQCLHARHQRNQRHQRHQRHQRNQWLVDLTLGDSVSDNSRCIIDQFPKKNLTFRSQTLTPVIKKCECADMYWPIDAAFEFKILRYPYLQLTNIYQRITLLTCVQIAPGGPQHQRVLLLKIDCCHINGAAILQYSNAKYFGMGGRPGRLGR